MGLLKLCHSIGISIRCFCVVTKNPGTTMKYLNVAEKNDAAKNIAALLSRGNSSRREGLSPYNKIYEFTTQVLGENCKMVMTSVSGHLLNLEFGAQFKNWEGCNPLILFDAPVMKMCRKENERIKNTLEREIRSCQGLIVWTDCDREGENIGFEVIKVCTDIKPDIRIYRAKFSEITAASVFRALNNLGQPNRNVSEAVDVRQELDLRTGAAFTRLQTLRLRKVFPAKLSEKLISYGSCQFPTLGFVVERYQAIEEFQSEQFWKIKMTHTVKELTTEFTWKRERLFDQNACEAILDHCKEHPQATVESVDSKTKSKWRPLPLDTVEMEKTVSRKLRINAKDTMKIAEKLYTQGYISYPRTETNIFPKELNLTNLVEQQTVNRNWGTFAQRIINEGGPTPRQGRKSDQAHPPIHPTKYADSLTGNEQRVYEFIVRHFLACVQKDAQGFETTVNVDIAGEKFIAKGLIILEKNYLEVYIYDKWNAKEINSYTNGDTFMPTILDIVEGATTPPKLLTEADLIALMEKHGIGTDATHAEHIDTIKQREYVGLHENIYFVPGTLGMGLVEGYNEIGLEISLAKPNLRAEFENDLKMICDGLKSAETVRREQIAKYRAVFQAVAEKMRLIDTSLANRLNDRPSDVGEAQFDANTSGSDFRPVLKCPKCGSDMVLRRKKNSSGYFISCTLYPQCKHALWLPGFIENIEIMDDTCPQCGPDYKHLKFKFKPNPFPGDPNPNVLCLGGCDPDVLEAFDININNIRPDQRAQNNSRSISQNTTRPIETTANRQNDGATRNRDGTNWYADSTFGNHSTRTVLPRDPEENLNIVPRGDNPARNINNSTRTGTDDILCQCNNEAILLTVRKDGANKGRQFYKCANSTCNFFLWALDGDNSAGSSTRTNTTPRDNNDGQGILNCNCGIPAVTRTVSKTGPNTGRQFYCCSNMGDNKCNFFKWADESNNGNAGFNDDDDNDGGGSGFRTGRGRARGGNNRSAPYNKNSGTKGPRKCGRCGQPGHTKNKCPK